MTPQGTCYQTSLLATVTRGLEYVEGVLVFSIGESKSAIAHAWNVDAHGGIVDLTLRPVDADITLTYVPVRVGTSLTVMEMNERGNPADLQELADSLSAR